MRLKHILCGVFFCVLFAYPACADSVSVPILMYHHFTTIPEEENGNCISVEAFREQMNALYDAGYQSVSFSDCIQYVYQGVLLPEKPILLTADDGYESALTLAIPCANAYGYSMSVAIIGSHAAGVTADGIPHFSLASLDAYPLRNRLEIVSHSYALHDTEGLGATVEAEALCMDIALMRGLSTNDVPMLGKVFVYPFGRYTPESERILKEAGYCATVAIRAGNTRIAVLRRGDASSLYALPRIAIDSSIDGEGLVSILQQEMAKISEKYA